jgi:flagellar biosynthetic protein FliP
MATKHESRARILLGIIVGVMTLLVMAPPEAVAVGPSVSIDLGADGAKHTAVVIQILILLTVLSLAPALFIMVTSFTRIVIVLSFLRQALGTPTVPPNQVLLSLALFLTMFIMAPVGQAVYNNALQPLIAEQISYEDAWKKGIEKDLELFIKLSHMPKPDRVDDVPTQAIIPAFILSELRIAFQIGFLIYIPFLIIDMVVASILMSMGMMLLPPVVISLPFKLILFVLADGWYLVVGSMLRSFQ